MSAVSIDKSCARAGADLHATCLGAEDRTEQHVRAGDVVPGLWFYGILPAELAPPKSGDALRVGFLVLAVPVASTVDVLVGDVFGANRAWFLR